MEVHLAADALDNKIVAKPPKYLLSRVDFAQLGDRLVEVAGGNLVDDELHLAQGPTSRGGGGAGCWISRSISHPNTRSISRLILDGIAELLAEDGLSGAVGGCGIGGGNSVGEEGRRKGKMEFCEIR